MTDVRTDTERSAHVASKDLEVIVHVLQEAISVIDDYDPVRNPARCMRQIRRLLDGGGLRVALARVATELPTVLDAPMRRDVPVRHRG